jgi:hypothetical protein
MGRPANIPTLRHDGVAPEAYRRGVVNHCAVTRRYLIGRLQIPRGPDPSARIKMIVRTHLRPEDSQQQGTPSMPGTRRGHAQQHPTNVPELPPHRHPQREGRPQIGARRRSGRSLFTHPIKACFAIRIAHLGAPLSGKERPHPPPSCCTAMILSPRAALRHGESTPKRARPLHSKAARHFFLFLEMIYFAATSGRVLSDPSL